MLVNAKQKVYMLMFPVPFGNGGNFPPKSSQFPWLVKTSPKRSVYGFGSEKVHGLPSDKLT
jgi:hypothetical protein